jgi:hypothetical protein
VEHFDYQVVTEEVWKYLVSWYDCDNKICRRIISEGNCLKLDLHPEIHPMVTQYYCYQQVVLDESSVDSPVLISY